MITVRNDFHNSETRVRANIGDQLSVLQQRRARAKLCGQRECTCCGSSGERGPQDGFYLDMGRVWSSPQIYL